MSASSPSNADRSLEMKIVLVGDIGVGKSSVASRFIKNHYDENNSSTIGASYMWKECVIEDRKVKFSVWDTAGQEQYHSLVPMYFRQAAVVILVYDITSPKSFEQTKSWEEQIRANAPANVIVALVGNKIDLPADERKVSADEAEDMMRCLGADAQYECSAKLAEGVFELFEGIAKLHLAKHAKESAKERKDTTPLVTDNDRRGAGGGKGCKC
ncbi:Ras-related protein RABF2a [Diplonema papillatum]|nr:Ras-related protein RABF2a [Diplonema papillatum]